MDRGETDGCYNEGSIHRNLGRNYPENNMITDGNVEGMIWARFIEPNCLATLLTKSPLANIVYSGADGGVFETSCCVPSCNSDFLSCPGVLVIDCRLGGEFELSSIAGSFKTFLPGILKKRMAKGTLANVGCILSNPEEREIFQKYFRSVPVVLIGGRIRGELNWVVNNGLENVKPSGINTNKIEDAEMMDVDLNDFEGNVSGITPGTGSQSDYCSSEMSNLEIENKGNRVAGKLLSECSSVPLASSGTPHDVIVRRSQSVPMGNCSAAGLRGVTDLVCTSMILRTGTGLENNNDPFHPDRLDTSNLCPVALVYRFLDRVGANVVLLNGGFERFKLEYPELLIYCRDTQPDAVIRERIFKIATTSSDRCDNAAAPVDDLGHVQLFQSIENSIKTATVNPQFPTEDHQNDHHCPVILRDNFGTFSSTFEAQHRPVVHCGTGHASAVGGTKSSMNTDFNIVDCDSERKPYGGAKPTAVSSFGYPANPLVSLSPDLESVGTDSPLPGDLLLGTASPPIPRLFSSSSSTSAESTAFSDKDNFEVWPNFSPSVDENVIRGTNCDNILVEPDGYRSVRSILPDSPFPFPSPASVNNSSCGSSELTDCSSSLPSTTNSSPTSRDFLPHTDNSPYNFADNLVCDFDRLLTSAIQRIGDNPSPVTTSRAVSPPIDSHSSKRGVDANSTKRRRRTAPNLWPTANFYSSDCKKQLGPSKSMGLTSGVGDSRRASFGGAQSHQDRSSCSELFDIPTDSPQTVPDTSYPSLTETEVFDGNDQMSSACYSESPGERYPQTGSCKDDPKSDSSTDDRDLGISSKRKIHRPPIKFLKRACRPSPLRCLREVPQISPTHPSSKSVGPIPPGNLTFNFSTSSRHKLQKYNLSELDNSNDSSNSDILAQNNQHQLPDDSRLHGLSRPTRAQVSQDGCRSPVLKRPRSFIPLNHPHPVEILPSLFLGNAQCSANADVLEQFNIRYVVNVTPDLPNIFEHDVRFRYLQIPASDHWSQDLLPHFSNAINFIDAALASGSGVLVHCVAGISRSVTILVAYLMASLRLSMEAAYDLVKSAKSNIAPNFHFMGQLLDFERQLNHGQLKEESRDVVSGGLGCEVGVEVVAKDVPLVPSPKFISCVDSSGSNDVQNDSFRGPIPAIDPHLPVHTTSGSNHVDHLDQSYSSSSATDVSLNSTLSGSGETCSSFQKPKCLKRRRLRMTSRDVDGLVIELDKEAGYCEKEVALSNNIIEALANSPGFNDGAMAIGKSRLDCEVVSGGDVANANRDESMIELSGVSLPS